MNWEELTDLEQLSEIDYLSEKTPVLIFKHSTRCSISRNALDRVERKWKTDNYEKISPYLLDLLSYRSVSNEIAIRYAVTHESPQVLIIKNGKCVYHASHSAITYDDLFEFHILK